MKKKLISILIANLFVAAPAFAQSDDFKLQGSVSLGGIYNDESTNDAAKMNDIRDLTNGGLFGWDIKGGNSKYWLNFFGENVAREDQYLDLKGGMYGAFKYRLYSDSLTRNQLFGGKTPYAGAGSANHTDTTWPNLNTATWNTVDVGYDRRDDGGAFEWGTGNNPWFFRVDGNQVTQSGSKIGAASQGMSPGNGYVDLAFPTEYTTKNWSVEGGYKTKTMLITASWMSSTFDTDNNSVAWTNGFWNSGTDRTYLAHGNDYSKLALNATFRQLPLNSTFAVRWTKDELESNVPVGSTVLGIANGAPSGTLASQLPTGANTSEFQGKVDNETFTLALASTPTKGLDTRLYWNEFKREDDSTHMTFTSRPVTGPAAPAPITVYANEPYSYERSNYGIDAFYRINKANRVGVGYDYNEMDRKNERFDFNVSEDKVWFVEWKTTMVENVNARLKYSNLDRSSEFKLGNDGVNANDVAYWNRFLKAFDAANLDQDKWKFTLDATPAEFLDIGLEFNYKENKYKDMVLGRLSDDRREIYGSISYGDPAVARWTLFGDYEKVEYVSKHRVVGSSTATTPPGPYDPNMPDTSANYNWQGTNKDSNYAYGLAVDWPASEKLMVKASLMYYKTDGALDFAAPSVISAATYPQPVGSYDDSKRTALNLKGIYAFSKTLSFTAGYAYEKYEYKDAQYDGYLYTIPASGRADSYLMGYLKDPNYKANIFYGWVSYKF